jgi:hypothetical protein
MYFADLGVEEDDPLPDYHEDPHHAFTMKDVFGGIFHSHEASYMNRYACRSSATPFNTYCRGTPEMWPYTSSQA